NCSAVSVPDNAAACEAAVPRKKKEATIERNSLLPNNWHYFSILVCAGKRGPFHCSHRSHSSDLRISCGPIPRANMISAFGSEFQTTKSPLEFSAVASFYLRAWHIYL